MVVRRPACRGSRDVGGAAAGMVAEDPHSLAGRRIVSLFAGGSIDIAPCLLLPAADTASGVHWCSKQ